MSRALKFVKSYFEKQKAKEAMPTPKLIFVTPKIAQRWLDESNKHNRKVKDPPANVLAEKMKEGKWVEGSGETIVFCKDGHLAEGQHRLRGVIRSGIGLWWWVMFGADPKAREVLSTGKCCRNPNALLEIKKLDFCPNPAGVLRVAVGSRKNKFTRTAMTLEEYMYWAGRLKKGMLFIRDNFLKPKRFASLEAQAVVVRAYHSRPKDVEKIKKFCEILRTGRSDPKVPKEYTVHIFREWMNNVKIHEGVRASVGTEELYGRISRHLQAYLDGQVLKVCSKSSCELFPLKEEINIQENFKKLETNTNGRGYWLVPLNLATKKGVMRFVRDLEKSGKIVIEKDGFCSKIKNGDRFCWFVKGKVVADATAKVLRDSGGFFEGTFGTRKVYDKPVEITSDLCKKLDVFKKGKYSPVSLSLLGKEMMPVSERDFATFTGGRAVI